VLPRHGAGDHLLLHAPKGREAEGGPEDIEGGGRHATGFTDFPQPAKTQLGIGRAKFMKFTLFRIFPGPASSRSRVEPNSWSECGHGKNIS
jgi:hypothetical protein